MNKNKTKAELHSELEQAYKRITELESAANVNNNEEIFLRVFEASPAQMALTDIANNKYVNVNDSFLRSLGFTRNEVIGKSAIELDLFVNPVQRTELLKRMGAQGYLRNEYVLVRAKNSEIRHGIFFAEYIHTNGRKFLLTVMNDVTEKMQAEERWQFALEGAGDGVWDMNAQTNRVFYSGQWKLMLGYSEDEIGDSIDEWLTRIHPDDLPAVMEKVNQHLGRQTDQYSSEYRLRCKDGTYKWMLASGKVIEWTEDKKPIRVIGTNKDISERKASEEKIRESEGLYHTLVEKLDLSLCRWLPDTTLTFANERYKKIFGVQGNAVGQKWLNFLPEETRASTVAFYADLKENPHTVTYEHPITAEDGGIRQYQWIDTPIFDGSGKVFEFQSVGIDITERKKVEESIAESESRLRGFLDATPDAMVIIDAEGKILMANTQTEKILGYTSDELLGMTVENLMPQSLRGQHVGNRNKFMEQPRFITTNVNEDIRVLRKDGTEFSAEISLSHHKMANNEIVVLGTIRDVTQHKHTEELIVAQRDLARLIGSGTSVKQAWDACLQAALRVSKLDSGGMYLFDENSHAFELVHHKGFNTDFINVVSRFAEETPNAQMIFSGKTFYFTEADLSVQKYYAAEGLRSVAVIPILHNGQVLGCLNIASHVFNSIPDFSRGAFESIAAEIGNIIIYQRTEASLQASRDQLSRALLAAHMGTWRWHIPTNQIEWSPEAARIFSTDKTTEDFASVIEHFHPEDQPRALNALQEAVVQKKLLNLEYRIFDNAGNIRWITNYGHIEHDADGNPLAVSGLIHDITERKRGESALKESESKFQSLFENLPMQGVIYRLVRDAQGEIVDWEISDINSLGAASIGVNIDEAIGKRALDLFGAETMKPYLEISRQVTTSKKSLLFETKFDTNKQDYLSSVFLVGSDHYANIAINITERKQAEEKLRESEARFATMFHSSPNAIAVSYLSDNKLIDVNSAWENSTGWMKAEVIGKNSIDLNLWVNTSERERLKNLVTIHGAVHGFETQIHTRSGSVLNLLMSAEIINLQGVPCLLSMTQDITERKKMEDELRLLERRSSALIENAPDGIVLISADGKYKYASPSVRRIFGYMTEEIIVDGNPSDMTHPDDLPKVMAELAALIEDPTHTPTLQYRFRHKNGEWRWIESTFSNLLALPSVEAIIINFRDIHERKLAEEALNNSKALLTEAQRIGHIGHMEWNGRGRDLICSDELYEIFDLPRGVAVLQDTIANMMSPSEQERIQKMDYESFQQRANLDYEYFIHTKDGNKRWLHHIGKVTYNENGAPIRMMAVVQDVTERKRTEESLRASEEKYRGLMESLDSVVTTIDINGKFLYLNDLASKDLGSSPEKLIGKTMYELFPYEFAEMQMGAIRQVIREDRSMVFETQNFVRDRMRWYRTSIQPIHDENGKVLYALINATDIDTLKFAQQELEELNRTLEEKVKQRTAEVQDLYDNAPSGYHSLDAEGKIVAINQTELARLGYEREEVLGWHFSKLLTPASIKIFNQKFPEFKESGRLADLEMEFVRKDGSTFPTLVNATVIHNAQGNYLMSRSTVLDNTERKKAENNLRESEEQNRLLFEESPVAIMLVDETGCVLRVNRAYEQLTGLSRSEMYGKTVEQLGMVDAESVNRLTELMLQAISKQEIFSTMEHSLTSTNGTERIVESHIYLLPINNANNILVTTNDISLHKKAENALRDANVEMARAMLMKDEFLASMSHELRTPLTGILGFSEALQYKTYGELNAKQLRAVKSIETSGRHLLDLLNDILDLSKIEAGKLEIQPEPCVLSDICQASLQLTKGMANQKHQRVNYSAPIEPIRITVDVRRFKQIIVNLLSNAIKFTPENGEIGLSVEPNESRREIKLIVWDKGIGIKKEHLPKLFQPFTQIDGSLAREYTGTGLGLSLVRRLAELHNSNVAVESTFGEGSRFIVTMPWTPQKTNAPSPATETAQQFTAEIIADKTSSRLIIITDDNQDMLDLLADFLESQNYRTAKIYSGKELLTKISDLCPDLILMDIQMPGMDGLETIRRVRAHQNSAVASTPIIAVTALAMSEDREHCIEAGANDYISKPVKLVLLRAAIENLIKKSTV